MSVLTTFSILFRLSPQAPGVGGGVRHRAGGDGCEQVKQKEQEILDRLLPQEGLWEETASAQRRSAVRGQRLGRFRIGDHKDKGSEVGWCGTNLRSQKKAPWLMESDFQGTVQDQREDRGRPGRRWGLRLKRLDFKSQSCH